MSMVCTLCFIITGKKDTKSYPDSQQIFQLTLLMLVSAYTANRPGALVYVEKNERTNINHFFGHVNDVGLTEADVID